MWFKSRLYSLLICLTLGVSAWAETLSDSAYISLITCTPGAELYARYGHTALRVCDPSNRIDVVFNYGIFDFNTDHFYWKFVRGETWYELGATPMSWFMREYDAEQRTVYEQVLSLTLEQRDAIWEALVENYQPENRYYLYNFVFDNCATRPFYLITNTIGEPVMSDYTGYTGATYRTAIRHYTGVLSWANAGINLLFGPKSDRPMNSEQRLFLPEQLMHYMQSAHLPDGTPLVSESAIAPFKEPKTAWYASWPFGLCVYCVLLCLVSLYDRQRRKLSWGVDLTVGIVYALLLILVAFLTFFSCHPLVGFGWRLFIIPLVHLCARLIYIVR